MLVAAPFRPAPWWRLPRWADITQYMGHLRRASGHLYRNSSSGHLVRCGCPCDEVASFTAVVSGVTLCTCTSSQFVTQNRDVNGTFTLTADALCTADANIWRYEEDSATVFATKYTTSGCTVVSAQSTGLLIIAERQVLPFAGINTWSCTIEAYTGSFTADAFRRINQAFTVCTPFTFTNQLTSCGGTTTGHTGTVVITAD
jgi:hypothetical protein